jgi:hypothetical protein
MAQSEKLVILFVLLMIATFVDSKYLELKRFQQPKSLSVGLGKSFCNVTQSNNDTTLGLGNCQNDLYYITLQVGTPPQPIVVQFDTGSNTLGIPIDGGNNDTISDGFNTSASSTFFVNNGSAAGIFDFG